MVKWKKSYKCIKHKVQNGWGREGGQEAGSANVPILQRAKLVVNLFKMDEARSGDLSKLFEASKQA